MDLLKKTIVLSGEKEGYCSVVRVGNDLGVKVVGEKFDDTLFAGVKLGETVFSFPLTGNKTEKEFSDVDFRENDLFGCVVLENGIVISSGGAMIKPSDVTAKLEKEREEKKEKEKEELFSRLTSSDGASYYTGVREKLDELFTIHPAEEKLASLIPNSEWIKIRYEKEDYYVVGRIRENDRVVLLGYGVPGKESVLPPRIASSAHFLVVDGLVDADGYWLLFQDATTGKLVEK